jgi:hypothetical protein
VGRNLVKWKNVVRLLLPVSTYVGEQMFVLEGGWTAR